jgi:hypothetical protein
VFCGAGRATAAGTEVLLRRQAWAVQMEACFVSVV